MANPSNAYQRITAWMHAQPGRAYSRSGGNWFEMLYKSVGMLFSSDIMHPATPLPQADDKATVDTWIAENPNILRKYELHILTPESTSNGEFWYIKDDFNGGWQKPIVQEHHVQKDGTLQPSNGYVVQLFEGDDGTNPGRQISPAEGAWAIMPTLGFFFEVGNTPADLGWGTVKATAYIYTGGTVEDIASTGGVADNAFSVNQVAHGFTGVTPVFHNGVSWQAAQAHDPTTLATHIVISITDVNNIVIASNGRHEVSGHGITPGEYYFVDTNIAGNLVNENPTTGYSNPVMYVENDSVIHVLIYRPSQAGALSISGSGADNFSYEKITEGDVIHVPEKQQMVVHGNIEIDENGELQLNGTLVLEP